jgi:hypothetical protein
VDLVARKARDHNHSSFSDEIEQRRETGKSAANYRAHF